MTTATDHTTAMTRLLAESDRDMARLGIADLAIEVGRLEWIAVAPVPRRARRARQAQVASYGALAAARWELHHAVQLYMLRDAAGAWPDAEAAA